MDKKLVFYYHFRKNYYWLGLNILALLVLIGCIICHPALLFWWQTQTLVLLFICTLLMWCYKYLMKQKLVEFDKHGVKIDHNHILSWQDVTGIEHRQVKCWFKTLSVITLLTKKNIDYPYNFMQKRCEEIGFGAFSIPLYDVKKEDIAKIYKLLSDNMEKKK